MTWAPILLESEHWAWSSYRNYALLAKIRFIAYPETSRMPLSYLCKEGKGWATSRSGASYRCHDWVTSIGVLLSSGYADDSRHAVHQRATRISVSCADRPRCDRNLESTKRD